MPSTRSVTAPAPSRSSAPAASPANPDPAGFGVYLHWPFCAAKCPYCDFNSHVRHQPVDETAFRNAFLREIADTRARTGPRSTSTVFLGGGTPSLMKPGTVAALLEAVDAAWPVLPGAEITLEANPGSVEAARFRGYRDAGVNRVSLGVQALVEEDLRALGRIHTVAEAKAALDIARSTFDRMSLDLIYARPRQTLADWERELGQALTLARGHLSLYQLTIEQGTAYAALHRAGKLAIPDADHAAALYALTDAMTMAAGVPAYEISNYAAPGDESRHNLLYWHYGEYAGLGPGAHGRIIVDGTRRATVTERNPEAWRAQVERDGHGRVEDHALDRDTEADEALLMGLRLVEGVDPARLAQLNGRVPASEAVAALVASGHLAPLGPDGRLKPTPEGRLVLDALVVALSRALEPA